jgi:hypothetical protein
MNTGYDKMTTINPCPRFIEHIEFKVYNRYGKEVFSLHSDESENSLIEWNGYDKHHRKVPSGVYYYRTDAFFDTLETEKSHKIYKGWIQVLY